MIVRFKIKIPSPILGSKNEFDNHVGQANIQLTITMRSPYYLPNKNCLKKDVIKKISEM